MLYVLSRLGKNMHTFYQLGEKYAISPPFSLIPLLIIFIPNKIGGGGKQKNIHPWELSRRGIIIIIK